MPLATESSRDWRTYNLAQTSEVRLFNGFLWDLLQVIPEPPYQGNGRPRTPLREALFCALKQAHTGFTGRRNEGFIDDAVEAGLLTRTPHFNTTSKLLNEPRTEAILRRLVQLSATPLAAIEQDFAIDSTAFRTSNLGSYQHTKHRERERPRTTWVKLHACTGVITNIVTDCVATDQYDADVTRFKELLESTAKSFRIHEVSADKAYSSKANLWLVNQCGGTPLIPFRGGRVTPTTGKRGSARQGAPGLPGSAKIWRLAYHYLKFHEEEFYARYHKRSNVEATFSAIKKRLGESLRSRTFTARKNEAYCKVIAYNIGVLIEATAEGRLQNDFLAAPKPAPLEGV
ncbi:MAG TPA: transposase [Candidatus Thermoplasmatota archaeon]|nr:transposase [Candidatus Thermoplasmatota archaeon]